MTDIASAYVFAYSWPGPKPQASMLRQLCDGNAAGDEVEFNNAINSVAGAGGGKVLAVGRSFAIDAPIIMRTGVTLEFEAGMAARVVPTSVFPTGRGLIELADDSVHATKLVGGYLDGVNRSVHGILYAASGGETFPGHPQTSPDPVHIVRDVFIKSMGNSGFAGHGMLIRGGNLRAGKYDTIRIQSCTGCGLWTDGSVDSHYTNFDIGGCGNGGPSSEYSVTSTAPVGHGIYDGGDQNNFMGCKFWYNRGAGFYNRGVRTRVTSCEAQDNYSNGFDLFFGKVTVTGCTSDSNGQAEGANSRGRAGFNITGDQASVANCQSFDRRQGTHAWLQQYGYQFTGGFTRGRVTGCVSYGNEVAATTGTPGTGTTFDVVSGNGGPTTGF